jgi:hypothetical protein
VIEEENLVKEPTNEEATGTCTDEEQPPQKTDLVRLPNRKAAQPECVPNGCVICLDSFAVGEIVVWSNNCQHAFHQDCVLEYLVPLEPDKSPCPICRQPFCVPVTRGDDPPGLIASGHM